MRILVVNPEPLWVQRVLDRLQPTGATVWTADDWAGAADALEKEWPDALIIEYRILRKEADRILPFLREGEWLPIIVPTMFGHADAEHVAPRHEDALSRIDLLVTRLQGAFQPAGQLIRVGKLTIDSARKEVIFAAKRIRLPPIQFRLLQYLALNAERVVDRRELVRQVWGYAGADNEARDLVKTHMRLIRRKLRWTDESTSYLRSVRGFGYMLSVPPEDQVKKRRERRGSVQGDQLNPVRKQ
ncbi:MAG TPA: winged helix-turn-helix domain-containing protein [Anaerolineae bacterium]|nr:winged helix-turn-helix domain-containing protein [Anaerolineae bacterium]